MIEVKGARRRKRMASDEREQEEVVAFLGDPASYSGVRRVERFETHGNLVFLAGRGRWKIKRAVRFPYMDFSTLEKRHVACIREVEINRRFASALYLGCVPITPPAKAHSRSAPTGTSSNGQCTCAGSTSRRC